MESASTAIPFGTDRSDVHSGAFRIPSARGTCPPQPAHRAADTSSAHTSSRSQGRRSRSHGNPTATRHPPCMPVPPQPLPSEAERRRTQTHRSLRLNRYDPSAMIRRRQTGRAPQHPTLSADVPSSRVGTPAVRHCPSPDCFRTADILPKPNHSAFFLLFSLLLIPATTFYQIKFFFSSIFTIFSPLGSIKISSFVIPLIKSMTKV